MADHPPIFHQESCPTQYTQVGGAKGPCLCLPGRDLSAAGSHRATAPSTPIAALRGPFMTVPDHARQPAPASPQRCQQ